MVEASQTSEEAANAATAAAADDAVTPQEVESVEDYLVDAETAIVYAEELIDAYYALYGELAMDTLLLLTEIEEELYVLAEEAAAIEAALVEIDEALLQGLALTEESLVRLESAAQTALSVAANVREQNHAWIEALPTELDGRTSTALAVQPDQVPTDRLSALQGAFGYVDAVRDGLADGKITQGELSSIAQLGANARAGLDAYGGPQLQHLSGSIDGITGQIASGQVPQARANLGGLESALGARPARPSRP